MTQRNTEHSNKKTPKWAVVLTILLSAVVLILLSLWVATGQQKQELTKVITANAITHSTQIANMTLVAEATSLAEKSKLASATSQAQKTATSQAIATLTAQANNTLTAQSRTTALAEARLQGANQALATVTSELTTATAQARKTATQQTKATATAVARSKATKTAQARRTATEQANITATAIAHAQATATSGLKATATKRAGATSTAQALVTAVAKAEQSSAARVEATVTAQTKATATARASGDHWLVVEVQEVTVLADKNDGRDGDIEFRMSISLSDNESRSTLHYPSEGGALDVDAGQTISTGKFAFAVDRQSISGDLKLHALVFDVDDQSLDEEIPWTLLNITVEILLGELIKIGGKVTDLIKNPPATIKNLVDLDRLERYFNLIGEDSLILRQSQNWRAGQTIIHITEDDGMKIQYRIDLKDKDTSDFMENF